MYQNVSENLTTWLHVLKKNWDGGQENEILFSPLVTREKCIRNGTGSIFQKIFTAQK